MPYNIKKSGSGYKVFSPSGPKSKKPMSKEKAKKQQAAIYANAPHESKMRHLPQVMFGPGFKK